MKRLALFLVALGFIASPAKAQLQGPGYYNFIADLQVHSITGMYSDNAMIWIQPGESIVSVSYQITDTKGNTQVVCGPVIQTRKGVWDCSWNTSLYKTGKYTLTATALDSAGLTDVAYSTPIIIVRWEPHPVSRAETEFLPADTLGFTYTNFNLDVVPQTISGMYSDQTMVFTRPGIDIINATYQLTDSNGDIQDVCQLSGDVPNLQCNWDTTNYVNGSYILNVVIKDSTGAVSTGESESVVIKND